MPGTGYVSIADYVNANQGTLQREGADLSGDVQKQIDTAKSDANHLGAPGTEGDYTTRTGYGDALAATQEAQQGAQGLGSDSGLQGLVAKHYGAAPTNAFDGSLLGGQNFGAIQAQGKTLGGYLGAAAAAPPAVDAAPAESPEPGAGAAQRDPYDPLDPGGPLKPPKPPRDPRPGRTPFGGQ